MSKISFSHLNTKKLPILTIANELSVKIWKFVGKMSSYGKHSIGFKLEENIYKLRHDIIDANCYELEDRLDKILNIRLLYRHIMADIDYAMLESNKMNITIKQVFDLISQLQEIEKQLIKWQRWVEKELSARKINEEMQNLPF